MSDPDPHSPTTAGPEPAAVAATEPVVPYPDPPAEPTPVVGGGDATAGRPAGTALPPGGAEEPVDPHPEKLVGAAFAGGVAAAVILKALAKRRHG